MMAISRKNKNDKHAIMADAFMLRFRGPLAIIKFAARTLAKPMGTVFEVRDSADENFRRVNRFAYLHHVCRQMKALTKGGES